MNKLQLEVNDIIDKLDYNLQGFDSRLDLVISLLDNHEEVLDMYLSDNKSSATDDIEILFEKLDEYVY